MSALAEQYAADEEIDLRALSGRLLLRKWWILVSVLLFSAGFVALALLTPPKFRAVTILAPATADRGADVVGFGGGQLGGLASIAGLNLGPKDAETEEALAVLQSREFTEAFIISENLVSKLVPPSWSSGTAPTPGKAFKYFDRKVRSVVRDRKTGLISLEIDWTDRSEAARWANELVRRLNEEMRARASARSAAAIKFLEKELQNTSTLEVRAAVARLMEAQVKQRMLADVTPDYSFRVVDKAIAADKDDPISPHKSVLLAMGPLIGLFVGIVLAFLSTPRSMAREVVGSSLRGAL